MKRFLSLFISISILLSTFINLFGRDTNQVRAAAPKGFEQTIVVGTGLDTPTGFEFAPDGRIFILERAGAVKIFKDGQLLPEPFTVLPSAASGDRGLVGIAFDPDYGTNNFVYIYYKVY